MGPQTITTQQMKMESAARGSSETAGDNNVY